MLGERVDQVFLVREVAVDGADADAGLARDVVHLRVEPVRCHQLPRRLDHGLAVAPRVGALDAGESFCGWIHEIDWGPEQTEPRFRMVGFGTGTPVPIIRTNQTTKEQGMTDEREYMDKRWIALALLCMAQFVVVLDASIVNVALPTIGRDLQFDQDSLSWVVNSYVLTFGGFLLLGGRLADLLGRRRIFIAGLLLFAAASLAGGFAESEGVLIAARAVQGLGGALLSPAALSIVTTTFKDGSERNKALGIWGAVAGSGGAAGVLLGGVLTEYVGLGVGPLGQRADRDRRRAARPAPASSRATPTRRTAPSTSPARSR